MNRLVDVPFGLGKRLCKSLSRLPERGRGYRFAQDADSVASFRTPFLQSASQGGQGLVPSPRASAVCDALRAIGIVQSQDRGLMIDARRAPACRMVGVAFNFCRPTHVTFDEQTDGRSCKRHGRRKKEGLACHNVARRMDVRNDLRQRGRFDRTAAETGQRERRAHQRQEVSAAERIGPDIGLLRKFQPHQLLKSLGIRQFVERAPKMLSLSRSQFLAERGKLRPEIFSRVHRWQTVQLVRKVASWMSYSFISRSPKAS